MIENISYTKEEQISQIDFFNEDIFSLLMSKKINEKTLDDIKKYYLKKIKQFKREIENSTEEQIKTIQDNYMKIYNKSEDLIEKLCKYGEDEKIKDLKAIIVYYTVSISYINDSLIKIEEEDKIINEWKKILNLRKKLLDWQY